MKRAVIIGCALLALAAAAPAAAASCNVSPQGVSFGSYDPLNPSPHDGAGNIAVSCGSPTSFTISLSAGSGSYPERLMGAGAGALPYNLYTDASRILVWGDGSAGTGTVSATATVADIAVYGRVQARANVTAGSYTDTIVVTVSY